MLDLEELINKSKHQKSLEEIENNWSFLSTISNQTADQIETALKVTPYAIGFVQNATEEMMMRCLDEDMNCWRYIRNPTTRVVNRVKEYFNKDDSWIQLNKWF